MELQTILEPLGLPVETGVFTNEAPDRYLVVVPLIDEFENYADDLPLADIQEARISIYAKYNYQPIKDQIVRAVLAAGMSVTARQFIEYETETGYYHYNVDVVHCYNVEETED
jgi:hypothetical protein